MSLADKIELWKKNHLLSGDGFIDQLVVIGATDLVTTAIDNHIHNCTPCKIRVEFGARYDG